MALPRSRWPLPAIPLLIAGMIVYGSGTPVSKLVGQSFPSELAGGMRMVLAFIVLMPLMLVTRLQQGKAALPKPDGHEIVLLVALAALGMFGFSLLMVYGMKLASGVAGSLVMALTPAATAVGSVLFMRDRPTRWTIASVVLAIAGVAVVEVAQSMSGGSSGSSGGSGSGSGAHILVGSLLVFGAVCCEAAYTLIGKKLRTDMEAVDVAALATLIAIPMFAVFSIVEALSFDWATVKPAAWLALLWWSIGTLALGTLIWYIGVRKVPVSVSAGFMGVMPLSAVALSFVLLGEPFEPVDVVGAALVVAAIAVIAYGNGPSQRSADPVHIRDTQRARAG